jgi:hypothetical protein
MGYPVGPLLSALAQRILANLDMIETTAPPWGSSKQNDPPYADTQLLISLLGVLIFPHERSANALGELLLRYSDLGDVLKVKWSQQKGKSIEISDEMGEPVEIDPSSVDQLPRLLRNSIAHFNIRPIDVEGRFGGVRVWNRGADQRITFVADLFFDDLRKLARFVLGEMARGGTLVELDDPLDPMLEVVNYTRDVVPKPKAPRVIDNTWQCFLQASNGDANAAKTIVDCVLKQEADRLTAK